MLPDKDEVFVGTVVSVVPFGAFVEHPGGAHGLLVGETAEVGAQIRVRVVDTDPTRDRFSLALA